jgi:hypothetical protein
MLLRVRVVADVVDELPMFSKLVLLCSSRFLKHARLVSTNLYLQNHMFYRLFQFMLNYEVSV